MTSYLDASALTKLVLPEQGSTALRRFLLRRGGATVTSALARTELVAAVGRTNPASVPDARQLLGGTPDIAVSRALLDAAADLAVRTGLRSLDAIHLATALSVRRHLEAFVTYDRRQAAAAEELGMPVAAPA